MTTAEQLKQAEYEAADFLNNSPSAMMMWDKRVVELRKQALAELPRSDLSTFI